MWSSHVDRRRFLVKTLRMGGLAIGSGGFMFARRSFARSAFESKLLEHAFPELTAKDLTELQSLPVEGREAIRRFFDGKCLNAHRFVRHICSDTFAGELHHCRSQDDRNACLTREFCAKVASPDEIVFNIETIATEIGTKLDSAWGDYCANLANKWNVQITEYGQRLAADTVLKHADSMIRSNLRQMILQTTAGGQKPMLSDVAVSIGKSAVLLLPLVSLGHVGTAIGLPLFFLSAVATLWDYVESRLHDRRGQYQEAITKQLAILGNRVAAEFEREIRERIADLHRWQRQAVNDTAVETAKDLIGIV